MLHYHCEYQAVVRLDHSDTIQGQFPIREEISIQIRTLQNLVPFMPINDRVEPEVWSRVW